MNNPKILYYGPGGGSAIVDGRLRCIPYPAPCGPPGDGKLTSADELDSNEWERIGGGFEDGSDVGARTLRGVQHFFVVYGDAVERYGEDNVKWDPQTIGTGWREIHVRKTALDLKRELSPDRAFETH